MIVNGFMDERKKGLLEGVPYEFEVRLLRHDGSFRWFLIRRKLGTRDFELGSGQLDKACGRLVRSGEGAPARQLDAAHATSFVPNREAIRRSFAWRIRHRNDQGHDSRTFFHITPGDRQAPPRHLQARALANRGPEPSSSVLNHLI